MAAYNVGTTLGTQLAQMMNHIIGSKQIADRLAGDFAAMETNGGASDADYDAIKVAMGIADDATAHALVSLVTTIQGDMATVLSLGGFYKWDPAAN